MPNFLYYLPNEHETAGVERLIDAYALEYAFKEKPWVRGVANNTPDGSRGVIMADGINAPTITPEHQWLPMVCRDDLPGAFLGWLELPKPADLLKDSGVSEVRLTLGDDQEWQFPLVRECNLQTGEPQCLLPSYWKVTADGRFVPGDPKAQWRYLWEITEPAWVSMVNAGTDNSLDLSHEQILEIVLALFRVNYRIGPTEFNALGVFTSDSGPIDVIARCVGWDTWQIWEEIKKKSQPTKTETKSDTNPSETGGLISSDGNEGSPPDTRPHART